MALASRPFKSRVARLAGVALLLLAMARPLCAYAEDGSTPGISEARAAIVCNQAGEVLWEANAYDELDPASITKVMTAMVALDSSKPLDDVCPVFDTDLGADSQTVGYVSGDAPTLEELLLATLVYSGNDAATNVALSVCATLDEFVARMNEKAAALGMEHTHFANVHGLEAPGHYSCAADLAAMGRHAMERYPFIARAVARRSVTVTAGGSTFELRSTDDLMDSYPGLIGIKTGYVSTGANFLGACHRDGITLYSCVLGCATREGRFLDTAVLLDWAYDGYRTRTLAHGGWVLRIHGFADNFALRCLVRTPAGGSSGRVWPQGGAITYRSVLCAPGALVLPGQAAGASWWRQDGRLVAGGVWTVDAGLYRLPGWPVFSLPLFIEWPPAPGAST